MIKAIIIVLSLFLLATRVEAKGRVEIPERNGVYNDPDHQGIKVRVFIHPAKGGQPGKPFKPSPSPIPTPEPVCSDDPDSQASVSAAGWQLPAVWTYRLNPDSAPAGFRSYLPIIAMRSFNVWQSAVNNRVNFSEAGITTVSRQAYDSQNIVAWGRVNASALAITYTRYYPDTGKVVDVDTIMNKKFAWSWMDQEVASLCAAPESYDAQDILTHELGHWLGLDDEYAGEYVDNTMYGYGSKAEVKKDTLTSGDIAGVQAIY